MEISAKCMRATFILTGEEVAEFFEGVDSFKYLGLVLHWSDENCLAVHRNIWRVKKLRTVREVAEEGGSRTYCLRKVLLHSSRGGAALWVGNLGADGSDAAKIEGVHHIFLRQVTRMKA